MTKRTRKITHVPDESAIKDYGAVLSEVVHLLESARRTTARTVNTIMTITYWQIGRRIVEWEQAGKERATYGEALLSRLAADLTRRFDRGFSRQNLQQMRQFYRIYSPEKICQTPSGKFEAEKIQTLSGQFKGNTTLRTFETSEALSKAFPLPWSHYVRLMSVDNEDARAFYEAEALRNGWSVRQVERQISTQFYERTALSRNKSAMLKKGAKPLPEDSVTPEEEIKDPFVLEFLGLKDEYSENDLEEALIRTLETFLLELGGDFAFVGRQRRLRIGDEWYRVDLLFFHRRLRCLVIIDLKLGKFTHADENPPVGLILCAQKDNAVAHYALEGLPNKVLAAEYRTTLPDEKTLAAELGRTRRMLEVRAIVNSLRREK